MESVIELVDVCYRLNEKNRFAVLVYARMKHALQEAALCTPYMQERRRPWRVRYPRAHWLK